MESLLVRLLIVVLVIFIGDKILALFPAESKTATAAKNILGAILLIACVLWLVFGNKYLPASL